MALAALIGALVMAVGEGVRTFGRTWRIAIDTYFEEPCLPGRVFLIKFGNAKEIRRGDIVAVSTDRAEPYIPRRTLLGKRVAAIAGDRYAVKRLQFYVNDQPAGVLKLCQEKFVPAYCNDREATLEHGELILMTEHPNSFDSRYWGPVAVKDVVGTVVWPVFSASDA